MTRTFVWLGHVCRISSDDGWRCCQSEMNGIGCAAGSYFMIKWVCVHLAVPLWCSISCNPSPITEWPHHPTKSRRDSNLCLDYYQTETTKPLNPIMYSVLPIFHRIFLVPFEIMPHSFSSISFLLSVFCFLFYLFSLFSLSHFSQHPLFLISHPFCLMPYPCSPFLVP